MASTCLLAAWLLAQPAAAAQESCIQCQHADCLKGLIAQKEKMAAGYDALARKWEKFVLLEGKPVDVRDFRVLKDRAEWSSSYSSLNQMLGIFDREVDEMASRIGPPQGCSVSGPSEVATDSVVKCETEPGPLKAAQDGAQCRQIGELIDKHESVHRKACGLRRNEGMWTYEVSGGGAAMSTPIPHVMQTPAGKAREEAAAYRAEIEELKKLQERAQKKCETAEVATSGPDRSNRTAARERLRRAVERVSAYASALD